MVVEVPASFDEFRTKGAFEATSSMKVVLMLVSVVSVREYFSAKIAREISMALHFLRCIVYVEQLRRL